MLNNLVVIPCRKNSKRIKNKNKIKFGKNRLFEYAIQNAKNLKLKKIIFLDSDDKFYKNFANKNKINFNLRPKSLANSKSKSIDFVLNLIKSLENKGEKFENLILLQTTSPFRKTSDIEKAYNIFKKKKLDSIVSVSHVTFKPEQIVFENKNKKILKKNILKIKKKILLINGAIYIAKVKFLKKNKRFFGSSKSSYYLMKQSLSMDLDNNYDLFISKILLKNKKKLDNFDLFGN